MPFHYVCSCLAFDADAADERNRLHLRAPLRAMLVGAGVRRSKEANARARSNLRIAMRQRATKTTIRIVRMRLKLAASVSNPKITAGRAVWPTGRKKRTVRIYGEVHDVAIKTRHRPS